MLSKDIYAFLFNSVNSVLTSENNSSCDFLVHYSLIIQWGYFFTQNVEKNQ